MLAEKGILIYFQVPMANNDGRTYDKPLPKWIVSQFAVVYMGEHSKWVKIIVGIVAYMNLLKEICIVKIMAGLAHNQILYLYWVISIELYQNDVIKRKHFPSYWPFVRRIHRSPVNSPHKGQWRGALIFSLIYVWINGWVNHREAGDLRRYRTHYDVSVISMKSSSRDYHHNIRSKQI